MPSKVMPSKGRLFVGFVRFRLFRLLYLRLYRLFLRRLCLLLGGAAWKVPNVILGGGAGLVRVNGGVFDGWVRSANSRYVLLCVGAVVSVSIVLCVSYPSSFNVNMSSLPALVRKEKGVCAPFTW